VSSLAATPCVMLLKSNISGARKKKAPVKMSENSLNFAYFNSIDY
jgi:hypothetical protein